MDRDIIDIVQVLFEVEVNTWWVQRFRKRHRKYLKFCRSTHLGKKRTDDTRAWNDVCLFVDYMETIIHKFPPCAIVNYDGTRSNVMKNGRMSMKRVESRRKKKNQFRGGVGSANSVTILSFVAADGSILSVHIVYRREETYYFRGGKDNAKTKETKIDIMIKTLSEVDRNAYSATLQDTGVIRQGSEKFLNVHQRDEIYKIICTRELNHATNSC